MCLVSRFDDMSDDRLWMVQVSTMQLQLFEKEVESRIHQDRCICSITLSVPQILILHGPDNTRRAFLEGSYILEFGFRKPREHHIREFSEDEDKKSRPAATKSDEQIDLIAAIQDIQLTNNNLHQSVAYFAQQMAERSDDISGPESLWHQCEAFETTLTDLGQYAGTAKPLGTQQIDDLVLLRETLRVFAWIIVRHFTDISDGAPWTESKYTNAWKDINDCCPNPDGNSFPREPNAVVLRLNDYHRFLKTIM